MAAAVGWAEPCFSFSMHDCWQVSEETSQVGRMTTEEMKEK